MSKKILIIGSGSYIGTCFMDWMAQYQDQYTVNVVSSRDEAWKKIEFSKYDSILHVAGIAHVDTPKANSQNYENTKQLYYKVNRDITIEVARKAKAECVKQFIFLSSIIVYGDSRPIGKKRVINKDTVPVPTSFYGDSKLQAEQGILPLQADDFQVVVIRPPMVYGKGSKGNYAKLAKLARKCPVFPKINNERSMIHVDNLSELIRLTIENEEKGILYPQNKEYVNTTELVRVISKTYGKRLYTTKIFNLAIRLLSKKVSLFSKLFGNLVYDKELSRYMNYEYCIRDMEQSIILTEK